MTKEELLIKRFNRLSGTIPPPVFKSKIAEDAYLSLFELVDDVTVDYIDATIGHFHLLLDDLTEYNKLGDVDKLLYLIDNVQEARDCCKRHFRR